MKKIKTALLLILCLCSGFVFFACNKTIKVESIELTTQDIVLRPGESQEIEATVKPDNAINKNVEFVLTDDSFVTLNVDSENQYKATVTAKDGVIGPVTTFLQVTCEDDSVQSKAVKITVYTDAVKLFTPQNLFYNEQEQIISWDKIDSASGYELHIDIENEDPVEILCATNEYKIDHYFNKFISVKVRALGDGEIYLNSDYKEEPFRFIQAEEPKNLTNEGKYVKFDKIQNAESYKIYLFDDEENLYQSKVIADNTYDPSVGVALDAFEIPGKTFTVKVQTFEIKDPENVNFEYTKYPSKMENSISITKLATPKQSAGDFNFTYSNKTLSWKNISYANGYVITRSGVGENVTYNLDPDINYLTLDTTDDKLQAGVYNYTLKVIGNNKEYLDSNTSSGIQIEKLATPTLKVQNGILVWNKIENISGYSLKIDNLPFTYFESNKLNFELNSSFISKEYNFVIKAEGNGINSLTSEESQVFNATKLASPQTPILENNKTLVFSGESYVNKFEIYLTYNQEAVNRIIKNNLTNVQDGVNVTKETTIDMSKENYAGGQYTVYAVAYADGYLYSNASNTFNFTKLNNSHDMQILDGELKYSILKGAQKASVYVDGVLEYEPSETLFDANEYDFYPGIQYNIQLQYYPKVDTNVVISNLSEGFIVERLSAPEKLYIENGEINFSTAITYGNAFHISTQSSNEKEIVTDLNNIKLKEDIVYTIKMCHEGGTKYLNSEFSNSISVMLLDNIDDLTISGDNVYFTDIGASKYYINLSTNEDGTKVYSKELINATNFSLKEFVKEVLQDELDYNNLTKAVSLYISSVGGNLLIPNGNENIITKLNRASYSQNLNDYSNVLSLKILPSPKDLRTSQFVDYIIGNNIVLNELYFDCGSGANMFELSYTNKSTGATITKILTVGKYLKQISIKYGVVTFNVDTSFIPVGTYDLKISSISQFKTVTNPSNNVITYNINSFNIAELSNVTKLSAVSSLSCVDGKIKINDPENNGNIDYIYLLTINGETIYDDVLDEGENFQTLANDASKLLTSINLDSLSKFDEIFEKIERFQTTTRVLSNNYTGIFNVDCYKVKVPLSHDIGIGDIGTILGALSNKEELENFLKNKLDTGNTVKSDYSLTGPIQVVRIDKTTPTIKNGVLEFTAVENATSYDIFVGEKNGDVYDYQEPINILAGEELKYDLKEKLLGKAGKYQVYVVANTNKAYYLSSVNSIKLDFEILSAPTLKIENGILVWESVQNTSGYKLEVYKNNLLFDSFEYGQTTLSYDAMEKSNGAVVESGNYKFIITALGELEGGEETSVISSLPSSSFEATKLATPTDIKVSNGKLLLSSVNDHLGVEYYKLFINSENETIQFNANEHEFELPEKYVSGEYVFSYQAIAGSTNYLTGNISAEILAYKLNSTANIFIENGEIYWNGVNIENYKNSSEERVVYNVNVKREETVKEFDTTTTAYILSLDDEVDAGLLYSLSIKTLGDSYYYLNSNVKVLENVAKLDYIKNFRIEDGKLTWTNPSIVLGTQNYTLASPNGLHMTFTLNGNKIHKTFADGVDLLELDESYAPGTYFVEVYNVGNVGNSKDGYHYVNSKTIYYEKTIGNNTTNSFVKLNAPTNLNIKDGINLTWTDNNAYSINKYLINLTQNINNEQVYYSGIISTNNAKIEFSQLSYYKVDNKNYLILNNDSQIQLKDGVPYYEEYEVLNMSYKGSFDVNIKAYGGESYITSDVSNTINIILPDPVKDLRVEHGKITWSSGSDANGYILTITRSKNGIADATFNKYNELIYVTNQTHYNLTDVGYEYTIAVSTYSLISNGSNQTMASEKMYIENYLFDSFTAGNGTKENPYIIANVDTLKLMKYNNFAAYKLVADLELTENFVPLFNEKLPFIGSFVGSKENGELPTIYNLKIADNSLYGGLLGYISKETLIDDRLIETVVDGIVTKVRNTQEISYIANVENLIFENVDIISGSYVGAVAGFSSGNINNIKIYGTISSTLEKEVDAGASKYNIYSGSVVGRNEGNISNIVNYATIKPTAKTGLISGGIAAENLGTIYNVVNHGSVTGSIAGGIVGDNLGRIEGVISRGDVTCYSYLSNQTQLYAMAGGIAGANRESGEILNSLVDNKNFNSPAGQAGIINSTNEIFTSAPVIYIGGLVGENYGVCYNNVVRIELYIQNTAVSSVAGKIFGYNKNNEVKYNYCLAGTLVHANVIQSANSVVISETNKEVNNFDLNLVNDLNSNNTNIVNTWANNKITWKFIENNLIFEIV